jgi:hypothetical protein
MRFRLSSTCVLASGLFLAASPATAQKFRRDDPVWVDPDRMLIAKPAVVELSNAYDAIEHTFRYRPRGAVPPAQNVNTLGEVPDSSWFTNRIGVRELGIDDLVRGPDTVDGPARPWVVVAGKSSGITPGFTVRDAAGDHYFVKFDPVSYPNIATSVEVIGTKLFHAFGYNVPENYIVTFRRDELHVAPEARLQRGRKRRPMREDDIDALLADVPRRGDGTFRAVFSRAIRGEPVGPRKFHGTRGDDPNDLFPHQHRRDLRGLRVFCAWLNHDDSRSINSLDTYVREGAAGWVEHYLIDFSSILGAGSDAERRIAPQNPRAGNEYIIDWGPIMKAALTFGLWDRPWRRVPYAGPPEVGRIEADFFRPERWKPEYPNPAFERMLPEDAFWAAKIVARFDDEAVRAIVRTGRYDDPEAERHLADVVIRRRDKVVVHYLRQINPLDGFRIEGETLAFDHLGERYGLGTPGGYEYQWFRFDNRDGSVEPLGDVSRSETARLSVPRDATEYLMVEIRGAGTREPGWRKAVSVYLRRGAAARVVVGVERES